MQNTRKRKFQRWIKNGVPSRAPLKEKRAFGAFKTNRLRRERSSFGIINSTKAIKYETVVAKGYFEEHEIYESLDRLADLSWLTKLAALAENFRERKNGKIAFIRLKLRIDATLSYVTIDVGDEDGLVDKWVGSRVFWNIESAMSNIFALASMLRVDLVDRKPGFESGHIAMIHIYTMRRK